MKCSNCNKEINKEDKFCKFCGAKNELRDAIICPSCGYHYKAEDKFCKKCGTKLPETGLSTKEESKEEKKPPIQNEEFDKEKFDYSKPYSELYNENLDEKTEQKKENLFLNHFSLDLMKN